MVVKEQIRAIKLREDEERFLQKERYKSDGGLGYWQFRTSSCSKNCSTPEHQGMNSKLIAPYNLLPIFLLYNIALDSCDLNESAGWNIEKGIKISYP